MFIVTMVKSLLSIPRRDFLKTGIGGIIGISLPNVVVGEDKGEEPDYFPLHVGDWWRYNVQRGQPPYQCTISVSGTEEIDGKEYTLFKRKNLPSWESQTSTRRLRKVGNKVYEYIEERDPKEKLVYNFDAQVEEEWQTHYNCLMYIVKKDNIVTVPAGTFEDCIRMALSCLSIYGADSLWFAPNVGFIKKQNPGYIKGYRPPEYSVGPPTETLESAVINGVHIGIPSEVDEESWKIYK